MNNKRMGRWVVGVVAALGTVALVSGCALFEKKDDAVQISMGQLPPAVKAAAEKETAGCKLIEVEKETKEGKVIYAVTYEEKGTEMELEYAEDGTLLSKAPE